MSTPTHLDPADAATATRLRALLHERAATIDGPPPPLDDAEVISRPSRPGPAPTRARPLAAAAVAAGVVVAAGLGLASWPDDDGSARLSTATSPSGGPSPTSGVLDRVPTTTGSTPVPPASYPPNVAGEVSRGPVATPVPSDRFLLSATGSWVGPDRLADRRTPEIAIRSYLRALLGDEHAAEIVLGPATSHAEGGESGPEAQRVEHMVTFPGGGTAVLSTGPDPDGGGWWVRPRTSLGGTGLRSSDRSGADPAAAPSEVSFPEVTGAVAGRLWYRAGADTWRVDLDEEAMGRVRPPVPGLPGAEPDIPVLLPEPFGRITGMVVVYLDSAGSPITIHVSDGIAVP